MAGKGWSTGQRRARGRAWIARVGTTCGAIALLLQAPAAPAAEGALLTRAEIPVLAIRDTQAMPLATGSRLQVGDLLEVAAGKFAQVELPGKGLVALEGPARIGLARQEGGQAGGVRLLLLEGWLKLALPDAGGRGAVAIDTPALRITLPGGTALLHVTADRVEVFSEASTPRLATLAGNGTVGTPSDLAREQLAVRPAGQELKVKPRPDRDFIQSIPGDMRESLQALSGKLHGEPPKPAAQAVTYGKVEPWLTSGGGLRHGMATRFGSRLSDPQFRADITAHLAELPEWRELLAPPAARKTSAGRPGQDLPSATPPPTVAP